MERYMEPRYLVARARLTTVMEVLNTYSQHVVSMSHLSKPSLRLLTLAQQYRVEAGE